MKRVFFSLFIFILIVALCSCSQPVNNDASQTNSLEQGEVVNFAEQGFRIVRAEGDSVGLDYAKKILKAVKENTGRQLQNIEDSYESNSQGEILIGLTNRQESKQVYDILIENGTGHESEYIIAFINGKIVINAFSNTALQEAVDRFVQAYCVKGQINSNERFVNINNQQNEGVRINGLRGGCYRIVVPQYNYSYIVARKVSELCQLIKEKNGYEPLVVKDNVEAITEYEIVVGDCKRDGVKAINELDKYEILNNGKTIFINGGRNYSVAYAVDMFINQLKQTEKTIESKSGKYENTLDYKLVWTDEFNSFSKETWKTLNGLQESSGSYYGMGTARSDTEENIGVKDGKMYHSATYDDKNFYGTYATTADSVNFTYGYTEISTRLADGNGIWHAFWTWSDDKDHIEIDIMECWNGAHYYGNYLHEFINGKNVIIDGKDDDPHRIVKIDGDYTSYDFNHYHWQKTTPNMHDQYHAIGCEWTTSELNYVRDGAVTFNYVFSGTKNEGLYHKPHYFILSMFVGTNKANNPDDSNLGNTNRPDLYGEYWSNGRNTWTIEYLQLFQKDGAYLDLK